MQGRVVISQTVNGVRVLEIELVTDEDGLTQPVTLDAPDRSISLDPASTQQAWAAYDVEAYADGYPTFFWRAYRYIPAWRRTRPSACFLFFPPRRFSPTAVTADTGSTSARPSRTSCTPPSPRPPSAAAPPAAPRRSPPVPRSLWCCKAYSSPVHHRASGQAAEQRRQ
ncbi:MAG: hypothetical protein ACLR7U_12935 [Ruthenibacterium lactatiformans]